MSQLRPFLKPQNYFRYSQYKKYAAKAARQSSAARKAAEYGGIFPEKFFNKKLKTPEFFYLAKEETANVLDSAIAPFLKNINCDTILEMNPGVGYFTKKLLDREEQFRRIVLIEYLEFFMPKLCELHSLYPERVKAKHGDLVGLWKLAYQDKQDMGMRVDELLEDLKKTDAEIEAGKSAVFFGGVGSYYFFKHLINSIVFEHSIMSFGHMEMFLIVPPPIYVHLTCSNDIGYMIYRSTSILFQIFFEHRFITRIPRDHFLPQQVKINLDKSSKLFRVKSIDPDYFYLVKIAPRRNIHELCAPIDFPALWYFVKQSCVSRRNRIIPSMEKYVSGCGPRLIINKKKNKHVKILYDDEDLSQLPKYSKQSTTMSCEDYYPNINLYTEFGDLSPSQMLTLFREFRRWPEYAESSFLPSLESTLLKMESSEDGGIGSPEEEDVTGNEVIAGDDEERPKTKSTTLRKKTAGYIY